MHFLCRLIAPRPSFTTEMTPTEAKAMAERVAYWTDLLARCRTWCTPADSRPATVPGGAP